MKPSLKKTLIISLSLVFSLALILGIWFIAQRNSVVYSANNQKTFLEARLGERSKAEVFSEWERDVLENNDHLSGSSASNNYPDMVGRGLLQEYFRAKESNVAINEEEEEIAEKILAMSLPEKYEIEYKEYEVKNLNISSKNDAESFKNYGNKLGEASTKNIYDASEGNEIEILMRAVQLEREEEFAKLTPIIKNYENLIKDLLAIETPAELASVHLNIINSLGKMTASVKQFNVMLKDPFRGLFVMASYSRYGADLKDYMKELNNFMKSKEITFGENEPGSSIERAANASLQTQ